MRRAGQAGRGRGAKRIGKQDTLSDPDEVPRSPPQADLEQLFSNEPLLPEVAQGFPDEVDEGF